MRLPLFFVDRPVFATVLSLLLVLVGAIAWATLPVSQFPDIVPPTIVVRAVYPGATAETVARTVATPLEQEINGVEGMLYVSSIATNDGQCSVTVTFALGTDLDQAQVLTQNRVRIAEARLPEEVRRLGVTTEKQSPEVLLIAFLYAPDGRYDDLYVSNYAILQMRDALARVDGVGNITIFGAREYSMRVWLDPERLAASGITAEELVQSLRTQNVQVAAGTLGQPPAPAGQAFQLVVDTQGRFEDVEQFGAVVVARGGDGRLLRVRDVARVELGARDYVTSSYLNGKPSVALMFSQRPGSNALATAAAIRSRLDELAAGFPPGLAVEVAYNPTEFVAESVRAVEHTVFEAIGLVVLVVLLFLKTLRATLVPLAAIPVSLVGTFALMSVAGFSLNSLSLFGLVLAIGIVVDDAIVVVENVERHLAAGLSPRDATRKAMTEVSGALVAIALVLAAVFVPTAFLTGISGQFYRQFALTIAIATLLSAFNSLTLSPALCALLLRPHHAASRRSLGDRLFGWFFRAFDRGFDRAAAAYGGLVRRTLRVSALVLVGYGGLLWSTGALFGAVPTGFVPQMDQGFLIAAVQLPDGASLERTDAVVQEASRRLREVPGIARTCAFSGFSGATRANAANAGAIFCVFEPFERRQAAGQSLPQLLAAGNAALASLQEAFVFLLPPPAISGIGSIGGFTFVVQDRAGRGGRALDEATGRLLQAVWQDPQLQGAFTLFRPGSPQLYVDVDRTKAEMLGVPTERVLGALQVYLGSAYVNDFNLFGRTYRVTAQADGPHRLDRDDVARLRTRSDRGAMVPLGSVVSFRDVAGPEFVQRYNLYQSAEVNGAPAPGVSSGDVIAAMERHAREQLPAGFGFEWTGLYLQQILAGDAALYVFPLCVLFVFLLLAALYESWSLPFVIVLIVPMCLFSAIVGIAARGLDNDVLTQIGFVVLVGLACKNAILIVEFARQLETEGRTAFDAAVEACRLRLRPILMTSAAFVLGVVPLVIATGAGAEMRRSLGTAVFAGMIGVTLFGLVLTPVFYVVARRLFGRRPPPAGAPAVAAAIAAVDAAGDAATSAPAGAAGGAPAGGDHAH